MYWVQIWAVPILDTFVAMERQYRYSWNVLLIYISITCRHGSDNLSSHDAGNSLDEASVQDIEVRVLFVSGVIWVTKIALTSFCFT